ncbi:MAG: hypothetical protein H6742_19505 [Alphaproteobacteria bacterium]|nr:hypothetical protein [Alphaproteobacteria bacterium]
MKIKVSPLVVAAAMGLLGPAALADDDDREQDGIAGVWKKHGDAAPSSTIAPLGTTIEVIPFEDRVLLDDGVGGAQGEWTHADQGPAMQTLCVDGSKVTRTFRVDGDMLAVHTTVGSADDQRSWTETFVRTA